ncbi:Phenylalanine--tRNA ligase alpha subunit B [Halotydeus destructor]|nr:Phenylalanine--tRNA ligase alpha subunit B [Halotydeus destructor]
MAEDLTEVILKFLESRNGSANSQEIAGKINEEHQKVVGAIKSLETFGDLIEANPVSSKRWELTTEGKTIADNGSHEALVFAAVPESGIEQSVLMTSLKDPSVGKVGFSKAIASGWIALDKSSGKPVVKRKVQSIEDTVQILCKQISQSNYDQVSEKDRLDLKKRKLVQEVVIKSYDVSKGVKFTLNIEKPETDLTAEMIAKGTWREKKFKDYNFNALGVPPTRGHLHPLLKVRFEFRQIFLEMGFTEMPTNNYVESSFWNFDALFVPQQHPARDSQDTFFVSSPAITTDLPKDYLERVKNVHHVGGYGSQGYQTSWTADEAQRNVLRTHTTAVSARMLHKAALEHQAAKAKNPNAPFKPLKYFSIDRVFRNETLDATHLAEFQQIEGVVANVGLTLGDLMGVIRQFFIKLGISDIKFKPAYNPYTEPSMEIFGYHGGLKKWVELGNSGLFRPEMLLPMGLPEDVTVIAWGLSLERPTMIKYGIDNIRDLVGHKVDLQMVYDNPICLLENAQN